MPSYMYTLSELKAMKLKRVNPFRSTSPAQAIAVIEAKYGKNASGYFYHRGHGNWVRYSPVRDRKIRHSKRTPRKRRYMKTRQMADYRGKRY